VNARASVLKVWAVLSDGWIVGLDLLLAFVILK